MPLRTFRLPQNPTIVVRGNPELPTHRRQWYEFPGRDDGESEVWCYTDKLSYKKGEKICVFGISNRTNVTFEFWFENLPNECFSSYPNVQVAWQDTPEQASVTGCNWPAVLEIRTDESWPSGAYRLKMIASNAGPNQLIYEHLVIIKPGVKGTHSDLLLITSDCTWSAYNDWGGSNHYDGIIDPESTQCSSHLSNQRPFARGMVTRPQGAPRISDYQPVFDQPVGYSHHQYLWDHGYSKKINGGGWGTYEGTYAKWLRSQGISFDVATQIDLEKDPDFLMNYKCVSIIGHDEYWSWNMRNAIDSYVRYGGYIARFAGNFLWQIRLEDNYRTQVCHKYDAPNSDPMMNSSNKHLTTTIWESKSVNRPGHLTFGLDGSRGGYSGWGGFAPRAARGLTVYRPEHWSFDGCQLGYGDLIGYESKVLGYEVDGLDYVMEDGLPFPASTVNVPDNYAILAMAPTRLSERDFIGPTENLWVGDTDLKFAESEINDSQSDSSIESISRGSAMIANFRNQMGEVFNVGTVDWVFGLESNDAPVCKLTKNVLKRYLS